jgi:CelD/BcsL family acetyltransferase involved in cellulose biosynthesis
LAQTCAENGTLRLGLLYLDDKPAAAQFWIVSAGKAVIYKLAYDETMKRTSAGSILSKAMFEDVYRQDQLLEIDYGVGSEPYKRDWMNNVRSIHGMEIVNLRTPAGIAWNLRSKLATFVKKLTVILRSKSTE